jgi:D-cysteine desulfhydrase
LSNPSARSELKELLAGYRRYPLAEYPTPLESLPRLSASIGRRIYIKRDDSLGPGLGGNKTRKLEYLLADALTDGHRSVVTFGGMQSNHTRITTAAARRCGLKPHLFFFEARPPRLTGNLLINQRLEAEMHFFPLGGGGGMSLETTIRLVRWLARLRLTRHYFIPVGGHSALGALGYVRAALEIDEQVAALGLKKPHLALAAGTGSTLGGLMVGLRLIGSTIQLLGIDVGKLWRGFPTSIAHLANEIYRLLGRKGGFGPEDVPLIEERYVGAGYAQPSTGGIQAIQLLARQEGILLDPIYTGKAFAGLLDLVSKEKLPEDAELIFLHTGGLPGLFAFEGNQYDAA